MARVRRRPWVWPALLALSAGAGFGLYRFQPWKLVTDQQVNETLAVPPASQASTATGSTEPAVTRQGTFISHEDQTSGPARVIRTPARTCGSGSPTSTSATVSPGGGSSTRAPGSNWAGSRATKATRRTTSPAGTRLDQSGSVTIWCKRFSVSFGTTPLTATS
jgi:hypothetical protein